MLTLQRSIETFVGYPIDWSATGAWVQAVLTAFAVWAAAKLQDRAIQRREDADLLRRRRAAWRTMHAVIGVIGRKQSFSLDDIEGPEKVLDQLDLSVFPEEAVSVLVGLRGRIALARTEIRIQKRTQLEGERVAMSFDMAAELHNLSTIREPMGMGDEPVPGARRPRTFPFFLR